MDKLSVPTISELKEETSQQVESINHHGEIIEYFVRRSPMGISAISRELHISRRTLYNWFENKAIHDDIIGQIGRVIGHDFNNELPNLSLDHKKVNYLTPDCEQSDVNLKPAVYWMNKYIELLEAINKKLCLKMNDNPLKDFKK